MTYKIHITTAAQNDLWGTVDYIKFSLKNRPAADALAEEAGKAFSSLTHMPERYPLVHDMVLTSWGIRFVPVKNYLAFYKVSNETATVHVLRFLYGKSDWTPILRGSYIPEA